jgi:hypothetical protein
MRDSRSEPVLRKIDIRKSVLVLGIVAAFLAVPAAALAQGDPTSAQYNPPIPEQETAGGAAGGGAGGAVGEASGGGGGLNSSIGSLPFTGMDLIIVAGVAFVLTGTGFALRRLSTPRGPWV